MMKKFMRYALLLSFIVLVCTACAKEESNELLQTEHVPGTEEAAVYTATPIPSPTEFTSPTATQIPTPSPTPTMLPIPTLPAEEPEFMELYRAMPAGVRIDTEDVPEEDVRFCFCDMELSNQVRTEFAGQAGLIWLDVQKLDCVRALYYRNDGKPYICDVVADEVECKNILSIFYQMYQKEVKIEDLMNSLPDALSSQGYQADALSIGNIQYLYLYK